MRKLKKLFIMFLTVCLGTAPILTSAACDRGPGFTREVDPNKTQIQICMGDNALGYEWADELALLFEEEPYVKNRVFEDGKMGAQVMVSPVASAAANGQTLLTLESSNFDVVFVEGGQPYNNMLFNDNCANVYDLITEDLTKKFNEPGRIIDKLTDEVLDGITLGYTDDEGDPIVKGLNYWEAFWLPRYDVDLFEQKGFFFREGYNTEGLDVFSEEWIMEEGSEEALLAQFVGMKDKELGIPYTQEEYANGIAPRSAGEDGQAGTWDDGLPVTFQDFYVLCYYMKYYGETTPFIWATGSNDYQLKTLTTIWATHEGAEDFLMNLTHVGTDDDLIETISADGQTITTTSVTITEDDFKGSKAAADNLGTKVAQLQKQQGKYYALEFAEKILRSDFYPSWVEGMNTKEAGKKYVYSRYNGEPIGIFLESTWSWNEIKETIEFMGKEYGEEWGFMNRRQGFFPVPRKSAETKGNVLWTTDRAFAVVNNNTTGPQREIAELFFQYCYTDKGLQTFTRYTGMTKAVEYDMPDSEEMPMSYFAKSVKTIRDAETTSIVHGNPKSIFYNKNWSFFDLYWEPFHTGLNNGKTTQNNPFITFRDKKNFRTTTAVQYFEGLFKYSNLQLALLNYNV
ncbi:MAG: hypothetical protein IKW33_01825 [Clostridia bacterium]|nr:hypothetical protein [Clostridia bacterium]